MKAVVLQHLGCEGPGAFGEVLSERGALVETVRLDEREALPERSGVDLVLAMGGPMSVNDEVELPWLVAEKQFIRAAVEAGVPYWGVCLGAQLLASALGARVYAGETPEVGVMPVQLTEAATDDPVFGGLPHELPTFQWHGDTFELPAGAELLASSPGYPHQAFRTRRAYAIQFHLEVSRAMAEEWGAIPEYEAYVERLHGPGGLGRVLGEFHAAHDVLVTYAREMFERFLDLVVKPSLA